ncbi:hypothetical protein H4R33_000184 [Dimargaris cristalligena]|uniref:Mitochondrial ribosomal protein L31 n=1 Tax=Dimargaris cristalligena TaxID=215637 RepID=A0A4Q0A289_9FUNG|nr:hypothetical protein H4R33_000184 [Dimargaris cristalligena]RKP40223.1 mitochondrial ribosomal protein L31 [Dimargaris cristalligena]|eukprot:RKP40223.1 mitochondrial ribosomal protein L31 [Dimargaris cristalligena]
MFGAFRTSFTALSGRAWHIPARLSPTRKANVRKRLRAADEVIDVLSQTGVTCKVLERFKAMPKESEMLSRDKYTVFSRKHTHYRKGIHRVPKFTRVALPRTTPEGF